MARFELSIYDKDDEKIKTFTANKVRWGTLIKAIELNEKIQKKSPIEQFKAINEFIKSIFVDLTDDDLEKAYSEDIINTFKQLISSANEINVDDSKN